MGKYIEKIWKYSLDVNIARNIRNNITLCSEIKFCQSKEIKIGHHPEEKQEEFNKEKMDLDDSQTSHYSDYKPSENVFCPKEEAMDFVINAEEQKEIEFNAIKGKQKRNITDFYKAENDHDSIVNNSENERLRTSP